MLKKSPLVLKKFKAKILLPEAPDDVNEVIGDRQGCADPLLLTFVVGNQLTLQCKISNNTVKSKGTAHL